MRGGRKKQAGQDLNSWDWGLQQEKLLQRLSGLAALDLWQLFKPDNVDAGLLGLWVQMVSIQEVETAARLRGRPSCTSTRQVRLPICDALQHPQPACISRQSCGSLHCLLLHCSAVRRIGCR